MINSSLWDYNDAHIHVKKTITIPIAGKAAAPNNRNKKVIFKTCVPFTNCIREINNTQLDNVKDTDVVMPIHNLI